MQSLYLLLTCMLLGLAVARLAHPPAALAQGLNWWVLNVALPALLLATLPKVVLSADLWFPVVAMWGVFAGAWGLFALLGSRLGWSAQRVGALTLACGLGNTSFVGYPLIEALRGPGAMPIAAIADQGGCFIALAVGGSLVGALQSGRRASAGEIAGRVLRFPPFIALVAGLAIGVAGPLPEVVDGVISRIGQTLVPLALFSVGLQLRLRVPRHHLGPLAAGLGWKLVAAPVAVFLAGSALGIGADILAITTLQAAMAPMVSGAILARQYDLEPTLAETILGLGVLLSLATVPLFDLALRALIPA